MRAEPESAVCDLLRNRPRRLCKQIGSASRFPGYRWLCRPQKPRPKDASSNDERDFRAKKHAGWGEVERSGNQTADGDC